MKLINTTTLELEHFPEEQAPRYAILSHTWGDDEVTFQDMQGASSEREGKNGYDKIVRTCREAKLRDLDYAWVDTCCIDKSSSAELSESINSMFRWYAKSEICFAYLVDVPSVGFESSVWFTRGWTLQELLAPSQLVFFDSDWSPIGTKDSRPSGIQAATGIKREYLQPPSRAGDVSHEVAIQELLSEASIAQKMSWAANRRTTRLEDTAYCLLGIFGINMPLLYGEGKQAFIRLQEAILHRVYDDQTIFAWDQGSTYNSRMLADSPDAFSNCGSIVPCRMDGYQPDLSLTNKGIRLNLPIYEGDAFYAILRCEIEDNPLALLAVPVRFYHTDVCIRRTGARTSISHTAWTQIPLRTVYLSMYPTERWAVRRSRDRPSIRIRANPKYFSVERNTLFESHSLYQGFMPFLKESVHQTALRPDVYTRSAEFVLNTTVAKSKFLCNVETREIEGDESFPSPLLALQTRRPFLMCPIPASPPSKAAGPAQPVQPSDHAFISWDSVIYTTIKADSVFGRTIYTVDIKHSTNRFLALWLFFRDRAPILRRLQLSWELYALWTCIKAARQFMSSAYISKMSGSEVSFFLLYVFLYFFAVGSWVFKTVSWILPKFLRAWAHTVWGAVSTAAIDTAGTASKSLLAGITPDMASLQFSILVVSIWMATIRKNRTASWSSRALRVVPLILSSEDLLQYLFAQCRHEGDLLLLRTFIALLLGTLWSGVSRETRRVVSWDENNFVEGLKTIARTLTRVAGLSSLLCLLATAMEGAFALRWTLKLTAFVAVIAHGIYVGLCMIFSLQLLFDVWRQGSG
ncbi:heterokaryon incompatibility protein-domain-containing protein [Cercophora newfieldiana]|uniref:Heterokaryon incompatibility protein-domain-containing protein n=1 Tax=Cercophora newfieldiana TaxID=92897 RepID=A0AA39XY70_9PEZI|nr:heterokaryon incompatibility protein-domain-containing protein [Cercophora newfieldiana]